MSILGKLIAALQPRPAQPSIPSQLVADLMRDEGLRLKPYKDSVGKTTIGYGRNLDDVGITVGEAGDLLLNDINSAFIDLDKYLPWWRTLTEARQRALANMCFNLGIHGLLKFKNMLAAMQASNWTQASAEARDSLWAKQVGQRSDRIADLILKG